MFVILFSLAGLLVCLLALYGLISLARFVRKRNMAKRRGSDLAEEDESAPFEDEDPDEYSDLEGHFSESDFPQQDAPSPKEASGAKPAPRAWGKQTFRRGGAPVGGVFMDKLFGRCLIIAGITLGLLIPLVFVSDLVSDRSSMRRKAVADIARLWGESQTVSGPVLVIPYKREYEVRDSVTGEDDKSKIVTRKAYAQEHRIILPSLVEFDAVLHPQMRSRGIYDYVVYTSPIEVKGRFRLPDPTSFGEDCAEIQWDKAWFSIGATDLRAITSVAPLMWNGVESPPYSPGGNIDDLLGPGFHTTVSLTAAEAGQDRDFSLAISLNGSGGLHFTPVGENTVIRISGDWPHPSFSGNLLPAGRQISETSFSSEWRVPHLSRTYPQSGRLGHGDFGAKSQSIRSFVAGVNLFEPVSLYSQVSRSVKYGILFIGLTFVALLSFELVAKARLHLMQYALVGIAMTLFYLVLLSLAEHTSFIVAFIAASLISISMNSLYIASAMRSKSKGLVITALLTALYLLLYALLQMEEYALLVGAFLVVSVVAVLMFLTRNLPVAPATERPFLPARARREGPGALSPAPLEASAREKDPPE